MRQLMQQQLLNLTSIYMKTAVFRRRPVAITEMEILPLVQTLINAGVNLNVKERCGATPLILAVMEGASIHPSIHHLFQFHIYAALFW